MHLTVLKYVQAGTGQFPGWFELNTQVQLLNVSVASHLPFMEFSY